MKMQLKGEALSKGDSRPSRQSMIRGVSLFVDGMSRAVIFSFGPSLVYRLVYGGTLKLGLDCAKVAFPLAFIAAAYLIGRGVGTSFANRRKISEGQLPRIAARYAGAAIALLVFTFGAGLQSVWWLVLIRFASGIIVGTLCVISRPTEKRDDVETGLVDKSIETKAVMDFGSGTAKIYMTAFAVSILSGGLLYRHAAGDATFRALTGTNQYTLSPMFLVCVSLSGEWMLRFLFSMFEPEESQKPKSLVMNGAEEAFLDFQSEATSHLPEASTVTNDHEFFFPEEMQHLKSVPSDGIGRDRVDTSEFFDCASVLSGMDDGMHLDPFKSAPERGEPSSTVSRYVNGQCLDGNDNPSFVPAGASVETVPQNYLDLCRGNERKAGRMWKKTQEWRQKKDVWTIHRVPNTFFKEIKNAYPHYLHGFSKKGYPVIYEQPGNMNMKKLFQNGCTVDDMLHHYTFFMEYISNHVWNSKEARAHRTRSSCEDGPWAIMVVMDVNGLGMSQLSGDVLRYLKQAGDINNSHYPLSLKRAFVVKSPFWLAGVWSSIKGILPESVQVDILGQDCLGALHEFIDDDQIPKEYGGSSPCKLGEHPCEKILSGLVDDAATNSVDLHDYSLPSRQDAQANMNTSESGVAQWDRKVQPTTSLGTRRRRHDEQWQGETNDVSEKHDIVKYGKKDGHDAHGGFQDDIWSIVSLMFGLWSGVQAMIEIAIPLWILTPPELGGLGYAPSRSGVAMFSSTMVLLWVMRKKVSSVLSKIPKKTPMRSFRIGVGSQSILLLLLALVPQTVQASERTDSVVVMAATIIFMSCIVLASILGRVSSTLLHRIASADMTESTVERTGWLARKYGADRLLKECRNGRFTTHLQLVAEIAGVCFLGPIAFYTLQSGRMAPLDGTCCLLLSSLITLVLYVCSFSLHLSSNGEFVPHPRDGRLDGRPQRCCSFLREVVAVSASDMASLLEEANWSLSPLLGRSHYAPATQN